MTPQVKSWFGDSVASIVSDPTMTALTVRWLQIRAEREPILSDFWHNADAAVAERTILFLKSGDDYIYLHHGRFLIDRIGFSMQGRTLRELSTRIRDDLFEAYDHSTREGVPAYLLSFGDFVQDVVLWGRLCLPLRVGADDPRTVLFVYCRAIADRASAYRALFEHSHAGAIIATPIRDAEERIVDAWIVAQNSEASAVTGVTEHATSDLLLRATPLFAHHGLWSHIVEGLPRGAVVATVTNAPRGLSLNLVVELIDDFLVVRATPICEQGATFDLG